MPENSLFSSSRQKNGIRSINSRYTLLPSLGVQLSGEVPFVISECLVWELPPDNQRVSNSFFERSPIIIVVGWCHRKVKRYGLSFWKGDQNNLVYDCITFCSVKSKDKLSSFSINCKASMCEKNVSYPSAIRFCWKPIVRRLAATMLMTCKRRNHVGRRSFVTTLIELNRVLGTTAGRVFIWWEIVVFRGAVESPCSAIAHRGHGRHHPGVPGWRRGRHLVKELTRCYRRALMGSGAHDTPPATRHRPLI